MATENLSQCHIVRHKSHADWRANELVLMWKSNNFTHFITFAFACVVFEHLFFYLPILWQNVVSCKFITNASMEFIYISLFQIYQKTVVDIQKEHSYFWIHLFRNQIEYTSLTWRESCWISREKVSIIYICSWLTINVFWALNALP